MRSLFLRIRSASFWLRGVRLPLIEQLHHGATQDAHAEALKAVYLFLATEPFFHILHQLHHLHL